MQGYLGDQKNVNANFKEPISTYFGMTTNNMYTNRYIFCCKFLSSFLLNMLVAIGWLELAFIPIKAIMYLA